MLVHMKNELVNKAAIATSYFMASGSRYPSRPAGAVDIVLPIIAAFHVLSAL
jgi:hypothetical protein